MEDNSGFKDDASDVSSLETYFRMKDDFNNSKDDLINALEQYAGELISIPLAQPSTPISQALKDFRRERILFNEVPFIPDKSDSHRNIAFGLTLDEFIKRIHRCYPNCDRSMNDNNYSDDSEGQCDDKNNNNNNNNNNNRNKNENNKKEESSTENNSNNNDADLLNLNEMTSHHRILQRACRTSAGADSFFMIHGLFATVPGTFVTQRTNILGFVPFVNGEPPVEIDVYAVHSSWTQQQQKQKKKKKNTETNSSASFDDMDNKLKEEEEEEEEEEEVTTSNTDGDSSSSLPSESNKDTKNGTEKKKTEMEMDMDLCAQIKVCNSFAIYDEDCIDFVAGDETDPQPWLELETSITDEINFKTGKQKRMLHVQVYCPDTDTYYPPLQ
jgi:hypothetical protein